MLYKRFVEQGTLSEPDGIPDPQFALPGTVNWMHALAFVLKKVPIEFKTALAFYAAAQKWTPSPQQENTVLEHLMFAAHQVSALESLREIERKSDVARVAIVAWYYGIYAAATAMIAAQNGTLQDDHTGTARVWDNEFAMRGLVMPPFDLRLSSLVESDYKPEIAALRKGNSFALTSRATNIADANGALCAYLSGSADFYRWRIEQDLRRSKEFKALNVDNFRTKAAKELRDEWFKKRPLSFLNQAFRYRGKANYREALYLSYGKSVETLLATHVDDLAVVLAAFVTMAGAFASRRLPTAVWSDFLADIEKMRSFSLSPASLWS